MLFFLREEIINKIVLNSLIPLNIPLVLFFWTIPSLPSPSHQQYRNMQCSRSSKSVIFNYLQNIPDLVLHEHFLESDTHY